MNFCGPFLSCISAFVPGFLVTFLSGIQEYWILEFCISMVFQGAKMGQLCEKTSMPVGWFRFHIQFSPKTLPLLTPQTFCLQVFKVNISMKNSSRRQASTLQEKNSLPSYTYFKLEGIYTLGIQNYNSEKLSAFLYLS